MSSKKLKKSSRDKHNIKTERGNQDVLVLPPDILQKLGINLGSIESSKENTIKQENLKDTSQQSKSSTDKESIENTRNIKSSFLETANLMKESVLLSPTFHTVIPNYDLNELNMVHTNNHEDSPEEQIDTSSISNTNKCEMHKNLQYDIESIKEITHSADTEIRNKSDFIKEDFQTLDSSKIEIKDTLSKSIKTSIDNISKKHIDSNTSEPKNQINIISQEVIGIDSLSNLKYFTSSDKRNLIPVNVDTVLTSNKILKSNKISSSLSSSKPEIISGGNPVKVQENNIIKTKSQIRESEKNYKMGNTYNDREKMPLNEENKESDQIADRDEQSNDDNISTKFDYGSSDTCHGIEKLGNCKDKEFTSKENLVTSKLCIQGVEKPGGDNKLLTNQNVKIQCLRTYSKSKKPKYLNINISKSDGYEKSFEYEYSENKQIDEKSCSDIKQNFCFCHDFGRFSFYEYDFNYEHIHFGDRQPVCSLEEFSAIYEDNKMIQISEEEIGYIENNSIELDNSEDDKYCHNTLFVCCKDHRNVCKNTNNHSTNLNKINDVLENDKITDEFSITEWMNEDDLMNEKHFVAETSKENDAPLRKHNSSQIRKSLDMSVSNRHQMEDSEDLISSDSMDSDEVLTSYKNRKKRKIPKSESDNEYPKSKKRCYSDTMVVCGVCKKEVAGDEWKNHISSEHDFIAWEEGETLDLEDPKLIRKLNKRLLETGKIICTFCDMEILVMNEFVDHIKICMHRQLNPNHRIKCGVCKNSVEGRLWIEHICKEHYYLAWEDGEPPLDTTDSDKITTFLNITSKALGGLDCYNCGAKRKLVKSYIRHLKKCANVKILPCDQAKKEDVKVSDESDENINDMMNKHSVKRTKDEPDVTMPNAEPTSVVCGVCQAHVDTAKWIDHICMEHNYAAWKEGETAIDVNNITELSEHLYILSKANKGLTCAKCGLRRKYVKSFLKHIKSCNDNTQNDSTLNESTDSSDEKVECGVCHQQMQEKRWYNHIQREHLYMAWKEGEEPIDFSNDENVNNHLYAMSKKYDGLVCNKCGLTRKYVKVFLAHTQSCEATSFLDYSNTGERLTDDGTCECGVCGEVVDKRDWQSHAMKKHYNVAWIVGDYPIDVKNPNMVEKYLKEYKNLHKKLVCSLCGLLRASILGFYAHVLQCGKTEEEIDMFKNLCDICNTKYLCIYKNQHLSMHKEQELSKECKLSFECKKLMEHKEDVLGEGRQAARKARNVIEKYKSYDYNCEICGYGAEEEAELEEHKCGKMYGDLSDSEVSVKLEDSSSSCSSSSSGDVTEESDVDSITSEEVEDVRRDRRKRANDTFSAAAKIKRIPFDVRNPKLYLQEAGHEYIKAFHTNKLLYPQWRVCKFEAIPEEEISKYMPPIEESCKLKLGRGDWTVFKKFEAKKDSVGYTIFVGSSIQCVAWAGAGEGRQYLAVSGHGATDTPRLDAGVHVRPNMLQIWDFAALDRSTPEFALGIAHEYGIVWDMNWCPSGTRDILIKNQRVFTRLGLLAIACSNGHAYILSIPYPSTIRDSDRKVYKLHPVAELRFCRSDREMFQATSISWSAQTDHANVLVGYSDGSLALYDLQSESPLLVYKVGDVSILYPYYDERPHNTCITGVATFPLKYSARSLLSSASRTGAECVRSGGGARLRTPLACSAARHAPHWPAVLLAENDSIVNQAINELDWWGVGRRLGALHSCGGCAHCGALAAAAPPALKLMKPHPVHTDLAKETVAIIHMVPLSKKRSKHKNDDFSVKLEPFTYNEAVKTYGVEVKLAKELDRKLIQHLSNKEQCPERFPLSDIPSMAFNPTAKHHKQLALATHAGFVFVINV